jgi:hypothetical protein
MSWPILQTMSQLVLFKGTRAQDLIDNFSHFLASFNNRQGRDPEFLKFQKFNLNYFPSTIGFSRIPCCPQTTFYSAFSMNMLLSLRELAKKSVIPLLLNPL